MGNKRTYNLNDSFFDIWTEKSAYWLGFIYADGQVCKSENCVKLTLSAKDTEHLEAFKRDLDAESPIKFHKNKYSEKYPETEKARVVIFSKQIKKRLAELGCIANKSLTCEFPNIPETYVRHFIRGYFDGDGSVYTAAPQGRGKKRSIHYSFLGTEMFLEPLKYYLGFDSNKKLRRDKRLSEENTIRQLEAGGTNIVMKFYNYLYTDCSVYLKRKKKVFDCYWEEQRRSETIIEPS